MRKVMRSAAVACVVALFCVPVASAQVIGLGVHTNGVAQTINNPACVSAFTVGALGNDPRFGISAAWTVTECIQTVTPNPDGTQSYSGVVAFAGPSGNSLFASISGVFRVTDTGDLYFASAKGNITAGTGVYSNNVGSVRGDGFVSFTSPGTPLFKGLTFIIGLKNPV